MGRRASPVVEYDPVSLSVGAVPVAALRKDGGRPGKAAAPLYQPRGRSDSVDSAGSGAVQAEFKSSAAQEAYPQSVCLSPRDSAGDAPSSKAWEESPDRPYLLGSEFSRGRRRRTQPAEKPSSSAPDQDNSPKPPMRPYLVGPKSTPVVVASQSGRTSRAVNFDVPPDDASASVYVHDLPTAPPASTPATSGFAKEPRTTSALVTRYEREHRPDARFIDNAYEDEPVVAPGRSTPDITSAGVRMQSEISVRARLCGCGLPLSWFSEM
jgi:hypothetical protein